MRSQKENLYKHSPLVSNYFLGKIIQPFSNGFDAWIDISHNKFDPSKIICKLFFQCELKINQLRQLIPKGSDLFDRIIEVETFMPYERLIRIWGIGGGEYKSSKAIFDSEGYDILPKEKNAPKGAEVEVFVELTKPGLIQLPHRFKHSNGTVGNINNNSKTIKWQHNGINNEFLIRYLYEDNLIGIIQASVEIPRSYLIRKFTIDDDFSYSELLDKNETDIQDILLLLSLLSRERIEWCEINIFLHHCIGKAQTYMEATRRSRIWPLHPKDNDFNILIENEKDLIDDNFKKLLIGYSTSQKKGELNRAINYNLSSHGDHGVESNFLLTFAALETLINTIDNENPLITKKMLKWKKLESKLRTCIKEHFKQEKFDTVEELYTQKQIVLDKIPEFRNAPIVEKIFYHFTRLSIKTEDLWPIGMDFKNSLHTAIKQRNSLIHNTFFENPMQLSRNLSRIQVMNERLILNCLGLPREIISKAHEDVLYKINFL